jgi:hypothetical protein
MCFFGFISDKIFGRSLPNFNDHVFSSGDLSSYFRDKYTSKYMNDGDENRKPSEQVCLFSRF